MWGPSAGWDQSGLQLGGYAFSTLLHELGHALGLAHPHDGGNGVDATSFPGVTGQFESYGDYELNQTIWTVMSYNDGWKRQPSPSISSDYSYGNVATPMALDIAAIQSIYGANLTFRAGVDSYVMPTTNSSGTYWSCIWDAAGIDEISVGSTDVGCTIDLRAAPLVGPDAGGYVSHVHGVVGGFTIANNVIIENASGGRGSDTLIGNEADNNLNGDAGSDTLEGGAGADTLIGGAGNDTYVVNVTATGTLEDTVTETGTADIDTLKLAGVSTNASAVAITLSSTLENLDVSGTASSLLNLAGNGAANKLTGNASANVLTGGAGADTLTGGTGSDTFRFVTTADGSDTITDFASGTDKIYIVAANFGLTSGAGANLVINGSPSTTAAAFVYSTTTGVLSFDSDGNRSGAATQLATLSNKPTGFKSSDFVLGA